MSGKQKLTNNFSIKDQKNRIFVGHKLRQVIHPLLLKVMKSMRDYELVSIGNTNENRTIFEDVLKMGPAIFTINHSNVHDVPTASEIVKKHSYLLASDEVRGKVTGFLFELMGVVWVQREKNDKSKIKIAPKEHLLKLLAENQSVKIFPERTWNVTDNEIILPFKWGAVSVAQKSQRPIIPIILEYDYASKVCYYNIGTPMLISKENDLVEANNKLRDEMATLRYEIWDEIDKKRKQTPGLLEGKEYTEDARTKFYKYKQMLKEEYPMFEEENEAKFIYRPYPIVKDVFEHLSSLHPTKQNAFLFNKRLK